MNLSFQPTPGGALAVAFAVKIDGRLVVETIASTERAAIVYWLFENGSTTGDRPNATWPDRMVREQWAARVEHFRAAGSDVGLVQVGVIEGVAAAAAPAGGAIV